MADKNLKIVQNADEPVPTEIIAANIVKLSQGVTKLLNSGLKQEAIVILLAADSGVSKTQIRTVLYSLTVLEETYCTKKKRGGK